MKVLFVTRLLDSGTMFREPLGILSLSSALKQAGHRTEPVDAAPRRARRAVREFSPDVVAYTVRTGFHQEYRRLNRRLKTECDYFSVFGGPHATFFPQLIERDEAVDAVCRGEGEEAFVELVGRLAGGKEYQLTENFWIRREGRVYRNPLRPLVQNLDRLPFPDRDLLAGYPRASRAPIKNFITARGCPFGCSYCFNRSFRELYGEKDAPVRRRTVANVIAEIREELQERPFEIVHFEDDVFNLDPGWTEEFCRRYPREIGLPFSCHLRADLVGPDTASALARAGCVSAAIGLEAGNDYLRNEVLERGISREQIIGAARSIRGAGIVLVTLNMVGIPRGSFAADRETLGLNWQCRPDCAIASFAQPYPGTKLGKIAIEEGFFSGEYDELGGFYQKAWVKDHPRQVHNLKALFPVLVRFRGLRPVFPLLVSLPLNRLYRGVSALWVGYSVRFKVLPYRVKSLLAFLRDVLAYLR